MHLDDQIPLLLRPVLPLVEIWVQKTIRRRARTASPLTGAVRSSCREYFHAETIDRSPAGGPTDDLPRGADPHLPGSRGWKSFLHGRYSGLTLLDFIYARPERADDIGLVFHKSSRPRGTVEAPRALPRFVRCYGSGLLSPGYRGPVCWRRWPTTSRPDSALVSGSRQSRRSSGACQPASITPRVARTG